MKQRIRWLVVHGLIRASAAYGARRGDLQARLVADPTVRADPVSFQDEIRARGRLVRCNLTYLTVDHAVVQELLRSDDFRVTYISALMPGPMRLIERKTRGGLLQPLQPPSLLAVEPPEHTRYRKTVSSVFTTRAVAALRERVEETAARLLDELAGRGEVVDIVAQYCSQLPIAVISDILGVPDRDRPLVLQFGELAGGSLDMGLSWRQYQRVHRGLEGFNAWLVGHLDKLRQNPGDDLMSQLIQLSSEQERSDSRSDSGDGAVNGEEHGAALNDEELRATAGLVLAAGFETTVNLLGNGIRLLLDTPDQLAKLRARPELWPNAVEEILRLESPVQLSARLSRRDTVIAGTPIPRGEMVVIYLAGANRDPAVFDDPHRVDVERPNANKHLSFSTGRHFCLGAALARAEAEVGLRTFFERFPDVRLAGAGSRRDTLVLRGWSELPVNLAPNVGPHGGPVQTLRDSV